MPGCLPGNRKVPGLMPKNYLTGNFYEIHLSPSNNVAKELLTFRQISGGVSSSKLVEQFTNLVQVSTLCITINDYIIYVCFTS